MANGYGTFVKQGPFPAQHGNASCLLRIITCRWFRPLGCFAAFLSGGLWMISQFDQRYCLLGRLDHLQLALLFEPFTPIVRSPGIWGLLLQGS